MPECNHRAWSKIITVEVEDRETGLPKEGKKFIAAPACGAPAAVSYSEGGGISHRCLMHMPRKPRDGTSTDPRSIGGSERFRYLI